MKDKKITNISEARTNRAQSEIKNRLAAQIGRMKNQQRKIDEDKLKEAIQNLLNHAYGDHSGSMRCAMFLLSLWDGGIYKADLQDLLYNDPDTYDAMLYVLTGLYYTHTQLDSYLTESQIKPIIVLWDENFRT